MPWWGWLIVVVIVAFQLIGAYIYTLTDGYAIGYRAGRDDEARVRGGTNSNFTIERDGI